MRPEINRVRHELQVHAVRLHVLEQVSGRRRHDAGALEEPAHPRRPAPAEGREIAAVQREAVRLAQQPQQRAHDFRTEKCPPAVHVDVRHAVKASLHHHRRNHVEEPAHR